MKSIAQILWQPSVLIFLGAILCAIGAFWASLQQGKFEHDLRLKSDEIAKLNKEIVNQMIGGDSFCYLSVGSIDHQKDIGILVAVHQGEHLIYDVNARIVNLDKFGKLTDNLTLQNMQQAESNLRIGNMIKGTAAMVLRNFPLGSVSTRNFNIFFSARNGLFTQLLRLRKIDNKWLQAVRIEKDDKVIFEKIDDKFPKNENGKVDW